MEADMKKVFCAVLLFCALCFIIGAQEPFSWDMRFEKRTNSAEFLDIARTVRLAGSEYLSIRIQSERDVFCYLFQRGTDGKINILNDRQISGSVSLSPEILAGTETFYVIMTAVREPVLEQLIAEYRQDPSSKIKANSLYKEILDVQAKAHKVGEPALQYTSVAGATARGETDLPAGTARYSGKNKYVRSVIVRR
jgi:hypothetical protein